MGQEKLCNLVYQVDSARRFEFLLKFLKNELMPHFQ